MAHSERDALQAELIGWLYVADVWKDQDVARANDVDRSTATRWRNGTGLAPVGVLVRLLRGLPVLVVADFLQRLANRLGNRDGLRIVVTVEDDGPPDPGGLRDAVDELAVGAGKVVDLHRRGETEETASQARHLHRVTARIVQCSLFPVRPAIRRSA